MKKAVLTLTTRNSKGIPIGEIELRMEFLKALPAPNISLFGFCFALQGSKPLQFNFICGDAVTYFRLLANIMATQPVHPVSATPIQTADSHGNQNGAIQVKADFSFYTDPSGVTITLYHFSFLPDNDVETGFVLGKMDADSFYDDFNCVLGTNPPNPA